jgi:hypothetical protein
MKLEVVEYKVDWNTVANKGAIQIKFKNNSTGTVPINSQEEFLIMLLLLSKSPIYVDTQSKDIELPPRPTGT